MRQPREEPVLREDLERHVQEALASPTVTAVFRPRFAGSGADAWPNAFLSKLNRSGSRLDYSTFLGPALGGRVALDPRGNVSTSSQKPPTRAPTRAAPSRSSTDRLAIASCKCSCSSSLRAERYAGFQQASGGFRSASRIPVRTEQLTRTVARSAASRTSATGTKMRSRTPRHVSLPSRESQSRHTTRRSSAIRGSSRSSGP